jgi:malic enzyme
MFGLSSTASAFSHEVLSRVAELNEQPIVFPLSNPATQAECTYEEAMQSTNNKVIFASGTAFPSYTIPGTDEVKYPGQGNNMYIFPGLGLGAVLARPKHLSDRMIYETAKALANSLTDEETEKGWLYPSLKRIRQVSAIVATAVCEEALRSKMATSNDIKAFEGKDQKELVDYVSKHMWSPTGESYGHLLEKSNI